MIKCLDGSCPKGKDMCCFSCDERETCEEVCDLNHEDCGNSSNEETALAEFQQGQVQTLQRIANLIETKKIVEEEEKKLKDKLQEAMEKCNIKKFESDVLNITYVAATTQTSVDSKKLKKNYPEIAAECSKTSSKSAYVKVSVK